MIAASDQAIRSALEPCLQLGLGPVMVKRRKPRISRVYDELHRLVEMILKLDAEEIDVD